MDTLKTAVVVFLLLAVVYGVYVVLNQPADQVPQEIAWHEQMATEPLQVDMRGAQPMDTSSSSNIRDASIAREIPMLPSEPPAPGTTTTLPITPSELPRSNNPIIRAELSPEPSLARMPEGSPTATDAAPSDGSTPLPSAPSLLANSSEHPATDAGANHQEPATPGLPNTPTAQPGQSVPDSGESAALAAEPFASQNSVPAPPLGNSGYAANAPTSAAAPAADGGSPPADANTFIVPGSDGAMQLPDLPELRNSVGNVLLSANNAADALKAAKNDLTLSTKGLFDGAVREAHTLMGSGQWYQALFVLSKFYQSPDLTADQHAQLVNLLDPLAAKVVYSTESVTEPPYEVTRGDTLESIAEKYQVPPDLVGNINGLTPSDVLIPGTKLKVVRGPFRAVVDLNRSELTLFSGQLYAGRFPINQGSDPAPKAGEYRVQQKQPGRVYYAGDGRTIPVEDPTNPYGQVWISLGGDVCIHGSADRGDAPGLGCISLSPQDAQDVYGILSQGSSVVIRR